MPEDFESLCSALLDGTYRPAELRRALESLREKGYVRGYDLETLVAKVSSLEKVGRARWVFVLVSFLAVVASLLGSPIALLVLLGWPVLLWAEGSVRGEVEERLLPIVGYAMLDNLTKERRRYLERKLGSIAEQLKEKYYGHLILEALTALIGMGTLKGEDVREIRLQLEMVHRLSKLLVFCVLFTLISLTLEPLLVVFGVFAFVVVLCFRGGLEGRLREKVLLAVKLSEAKRLT